jgi:hypothetical protein
MHKILSIGLSCFMLSGCVAHAHSGHPAKTVVSVTLGWNWIPAHYERGHWVRGHWRHPHYGASHRTLRQGPPPIRPHAKAIWVSGHWKYHNGHRHWISGKWVHTPAKRR